MGPSVCAASDAPAAAALVPTNSRRDQSLRFPFTASPVPRSVYYAPLDRAGGGLQTRDVRVPGELRSVLCLLGALPGVARAQQPLSPWAFGPFHKPRAMNPVIAPSPSATLRSPMNDSLVRWEEHATLNPAAVVTSRDLTNWTKHGPAFAAASGGKYRDVASKSGAIVARVEGDRVIATRVNGKYWMYFNVPEIMIATSEDLMQWTPVEDAQGKPLRVLGPRPGYFDSWLVEAGPPAILTERGIVVLYNAGNSG